MSPSAHTTTEHTVTTDVTGTLTSIAAKPFCSCGWSGRWHHADEFGPDTDDDVSNAELAVGAAEDEGIDHLVGAEQNAAWSTYAAARYR